MLCPLIGQKSFWTWVKRKIIDNKFWILEKIEFTDFSKKSHKKVTMTMSIICCPSFFESYFMYQSVRLSSFFFEGSKLVFWLKMNIL